MSHQNEENLKELFEKFLDAESAERCVEDVQKAEQIFREHPAPEPDDMLIANIKAEIAMRLPSRRADVFRRMVYRAAAVAAAVIVLTAIGLRLSEKDRSEPGPAVYASIIPAAIWESDDITADDADLAVFTTEIEQIEDELLALQLGEGAGSDESTLSELELEIELMEVNGDFWKG